MRKIYAYKNGNICPVLCFLDEADGKLKNKFQSVLIHISNIKNGLCEPYVRHISQNRFKDMYEMRLKVSGIMARIIFLKQENDIVLLYGFYKNDKKDTKMALERAFKISNEIKKNNKFVEVQIV